MKQPGLEDGKGLVGQVVADVFAVASATGARDLTGRGANYCPVTANCIAEVLVAKLNAQVPGC